MAGLHIDLDLLTRFEMGLEPRHPEEAAVPARVLGHGEISTVLAIGDARAPALSYKRMPMFRSADEAVQYEALHRRYVRTLGERAGLHVAPCTAVHVVDSVHDRVVVYIVQSQLPEDTAGNEVIYRVSSADINRLILAILRETGRVFDFNRVHQGDLELGFDAQVSNWAIVGFDPERSRLPDRVQLSYIDTSTPLMRKRGQEQLHPELFLRCAPAPLVPLFRRTIVPELLTRYYDFRRVAMLLVANFNKEGRPELIPELVDTVNWFFLAERLEHHFRPVTLDEIRRYYRWDAFVWRTYGAMRRLDRALVRLRGKDYPYVLPGRIRR